MFTFGTDKFVTNFDLGITRNLRNYIYIWYTNNVIWNWQLFGKSTLIESSEKENKTLWMKTSESHLKDASFPIDKPGILGRTNEDRKKSTNVEI